LLSALPSAMIGWSLGVHIDIAGRDDVTLCRDRPLSGLWGNPTHSGDLAVFDRNIAVEPRIARAVDHSAAVNDDVELSHFSLLFTKSHGLL